MAYLDKVRINNTDYQLVGTGEMLPVGTELDIDKNATIPDGWEEIEYDTGWVDITSKIDTTKYVVQTGSGVNINTEYTPKIRRIGNVVYLRGCVKVQKSSLTKNAMNLISSKLDDKFLPEKNEVLIPASNIATSVLVLYITSRARTRDNGCLACWPDNDEWSLIPSSVTEIKIKFDSTWAVDDLPTKRIKKVSETQVPSVGEVYDDQERIIGNWFGQPLYRKVIVKTATEMKALPQDSSGRYKLSVQDLNIDLLTAANTVCVYNDGTSNIHHCKCYFSMPGISTATYDMTIIGINDGYLICRYTTNILDKLTSNVNIILEYTKQVAQ